MNLLSTLIGGLTEKAPKRTDGAMRQAKYSDKLIEQIGRDEYNRRRREARRKRDAMPVGSWSIDPALTGRFELVGGIAYPCVTFMRAIKAHHRYDEKMPGYIEHSGHSFPIGEHREQHRTDGA